jgi:isoquinoline 1-oxidoreductase alpha subunit
LTNSLRWYIRFTKATKLEFRLKQGSAEGAFGCGRLPRSSSASLGARPAAIWGEVPSGRQTHINQQNTSFSSQAGAGAETIAALQDAAGIRSPPRNERVRYVIALKFALREVSEMAKLRVNGADKEVGSDPNTPLLWVLRDELGMTGTKYGCGTGICGACTVHVDGVAVRSCIMSVSEVSGKSVTTIEGLSPDGNHPVQKAWRELSVPQCGFCQAGQIMQAAALIAKNPSLSEADIDSGMAGNICRCGCYQRIHEAVKLAAGGV